MSETMSVQSIEAPSGSPARARTPLEEYLLSLHRLASVLAESNIFQENGIGLAEWVILQEVGPTPMPMTSLIRRTGLSRQRVRILLRELRAKKMVMIIDGTAGDRRARSVVASPAATKALGAVAERLGLVDVPGTAKGLPRATTLNLRLMRGLRSLRAPPAQASPGIPDRLPGEAIPPWRKEA
jgi:hypothetical protein